jgi:xylulokinase
MSAGRDLLLGLDVGTTATKAVLFDLAGHTVASSTQSYGLITPRQGWVEQDPEALWQAVVTTIRTVTAQKGPRDRVMALSQASQGGTTLPVDGRGRPTHNAISWMDERANAEAERIDTCLGKEYVQTTTGWPLGPTLPLKHIAWLRAHEPQVFGRTARFMFVNDFITERLTGAAAMNPSDATMTQLLDIATATWDARLLGAAGVAVEQLSPILASGQRVGQLSADASHLLGLTEETIVVNGAHDQYCAAVGTGVTEPGEMLLSCGTAWVLLTVPITLRAGLESGMSVSCHAVPGRWGAIRSLSAVGASLEWFVTQIWRRSGQTERETDYASLNASAAAVPLGAHSLTFLPLSGGHISGHSGGGFVGLILSHTRDDMARAVMEGVTFELRWAIDDIRDHGVTADTLKMVGGATESRIWPQIVADITALPVTVPAARQAAARGAALLAGVGAGLFDDAITGYATFHSEDTEVAPDPDHVDDYTRQFERYRRYYLALAEETGSQRRTF